MWKPHASLLSLLWALSTMASTNVFASGQCSAQSPQQPVQLVELYTSEGCSSCPPADHWLSSLPAGEHVIPLAFHVDYWNYLGWRDRFSDERFTQRQRGVGAYNRQSTIYTPEVVVNGKEHRRWNTGLASSSAQTQGFPFSIDASFKAQQVSVKLSSEQNWPSQARAFIAVTESKLLTSVERGENRGRSLSHDHVVRAFNGPYRPDQVLETEVPGDLKAANAALVVWLEDRATGQTVQALTMPLGPCAADA